MEDTSEQKRHRGGVHWYLRIGDILVLILFASIGRASHAERLDVVGILETAAPFILGWLIAAPFLGAYRPEATAGPRAALTTTVRAWIVSIPLGLLLRAFYLRTGIPLSFAIVTLLTTLVLLSLWRVSMAMIRGGQ